MGAVGLVYIAGNFKPFYGFREIKRGRNKGCVEVSIRSIRGSKKKGWWKIVDKTEIVMREQVKRFPAGENINHPIQEEAMNRIDE